MSGNVWEWCEDDWHINYDKAPDDGKAWINSSRSRNRMFRGGSWFNLAQGCRVAYRLSRWPYKRYYDLGFRLVLAPLI
jgi:formylglycine-generating enzyme required for sulfatase activity